MLEKDFNEYDNDYITIWSKYLLLDEMTYDETNKLCKSIEKLAEQGQINAVNGYFLLKSQMNEQANNEQIKSQLNNPLSFEEKWSHFHMIENKVKNDKDNPFHEIYNEWKNSIELKKDIIFDDGWWESKEYRKYRAYNYVACDKFEKTDFIKELRELVYEGESLLYNSQCPIISQAFLFQRLYGIYCAYGAFLGNFTYDFPKKDIKSIYKELKKELKNNPDNVVLNYIYARHLYTFGDKLSNLLVKELTLRKEYENIFQNLSSRRLTTVKSHNKDNSLVDELYLNEDIKAEDGTNDKNDIKNLK